APVTLSHTLRYSPAPGYQRDDWSSGANRTASTFSSPNLMCGVRSSAKLSYPYGRPPTFCPLIHTVEFDIAPSNCTLKCLPFALAGTVKCLRYHAVPKCGSDPVCGLI